MSGDEAWRIYASDDGLVRVNYGDKGPTLYIGQIEDALALAERIRAEFIPDTSGAVRIRQSWRASVDPHAVIVLHVQSPELRYDEWRRVLEVIRQIEELASMITRRLG